MCSANSNNTLCTKLKIILVNNTGNIVPVNNSDNIESVNNTGITVPVIWQ